MRLFLALDLPADVRAELAAIQQVLAARACGWRFIPSGGIHLTLRFLGEVRPDVDSPLRAAWRDAVAVFPSVRFRIEGTGVFPGPARPRILWIGVHEQPGPAILGPLAAALEATARRHGFAPEDRPFRPHLTLARARDARPSCTEGPLAVASAVECREVVLFESALGPSGARYTALESFPLAGPRS